jgi:hypothetical protein
MTQYILKWNKRLGVEKVEMKNLNMLVIRVVSGTYYCTLLGVSQRGFAFHCEASEGSCPLAKRHRRGVAPARASLLQLFRYVLALHPAPEATLD